MRLKLTPVKFWISLLIPCIRTSEIFLRELISNASDAIDKRRYLAATDQSLQSDEAAAITLVADAKAKTLTIRDSGIGLNADDLTSSLGTIARSG